MHPRCYGNMYSSEANENKIMSTLPPHEKKKSHFPGKSLVMMEFAFGEKYREKIILTDKPVTFFKPSNGVKKHFEMKATPNILYSKLTWPSGWSLRMPLQMKISTVKYSFG